MYLCDKIKERRTYLRLSQKELAEYLCVTQQAVSRWENGSAVPDYLMMFQLADALCLEPSVLLSLRPVRKVYDVWDRDKNTHFGLIGEENKRRWIRENLRTYIIKECGSGNLSIQKPNTNQQPGYRPL